MEEDTGDVSVACGIGYPCECEYFYVDSMGN